MHVLTRASLAAGAIKIDHTTPSETSPVRVLQIGDGNFLRAFADWMIDIANGAGVCNLAVSMMAARGPGCVPKMRAQDCLYTVVSRDTVERLQTELADRERTLEDLERLRAELAQREEALTATAAEAASSREQVERLAASCEVPFEAFAPLVVSSIDNAFRLGAAAALTGPVARGDLATVEQHLTALDPAERDAYRALAREAARLTGRRDSGLDRLLRDLVQGEQDSP